MAKTIGELSDEALALKLQEKQLRADADALKDRREELEKLLSEEAAKQGLTTGGGSTSRFDVREETVPHVQDWDKLYAYMVKKKYFHLLQRRAATKAMQELWERGIAVPGVEKFAMIKVTVKGTD